MSVGTTSEGSTSGGQTEETVRVEKRDGWRLLTLNRPDARNAFREHTLDELLPYRFGL